MRLVLAIFITLFAVPSYGQFVTVVGKDSNPDDDFTFVAMVEIPNGTTIYFTNRAWDNTTGQFAADGEGTLKFDATSTIPKGTLTLITESSANTFTVQSNSGMGLGMGLGSAALVSGSDDWSPTSADPHYAFRSDTPGMDPGVNVDEIYALTSTINMGFAAAMDPTTGTNSSPSAQVVNYTTQITGIDFNGDRSTATPATVTNTANYLEGASLALNTAFFSSNALPVELESFSVD